MIKRRLTLSLVALIGSALLLVIASFAWFNVSEIVNLDDNTILVRDIDVSATLYESDDDLLYTEVTGESSISIIDSVPGTVKYFRVDLTNNNDFAISLDMLLYGFTTTYKDIGGDTSNYSAGRTLMDVMKLSSSNNINSDTIDDQNFTALETSSTIKTHAGIQLSPLGTAELYFSITFPSTVGNNYENLRLDISNVYIQSAG